MPNGYDSSEGLAFKLPWDKMIEQSQYVKQQEKQYMAANQQKMQAIANMQQQTYTDLPVVNKELEKYYEGLNEDVGRVITKYGGDPFTSLDGMNELNGIHSKYLNNDLLLNAQQSKKNYEMMVQDYQAGRISTSDYKNLQQKYFEYGDKGDPKTGLETPWTYERPNYRTENDVMSDAIKSYNTQMIGVKKDESGNVTGYSQGYSDKQFSDMADGIIVDPNNEKYLEDLAARMKQAGITNFNLKEYLIEQLKLHYPAQSNLHMGGGGSKSGSTEGEKTSAFEDYIVTGSGTKDNPNIQYLVPRNNKGEIMQNLVGFGPGTEPYSFKLNGKPAVLVSAANLDEDTKMADAQLMMARQDFMDNYIDTINKANREVASQFDDMSGDGWWTSTTKKVTRELPGTNGQTVTDGEVEQHIPETSMSEDHWLALAGKLGFKVNDPRVKEMLLNANDSYLTQQNNYKDYNDAYNGVNLVVKPKLTKELKPLKEGEHYGQFSNNSLLYFMAYSHATDVDQNAESTSDLAKLMTTLKGGKEDKKLMRINGAKVFTSMGVQQIADFNKNSGNKQAIYNSYSQALGKQGASKEYMVGGSQQGTMPWAINKDGKFMGPIKHMDGTPVVMSKLSNIPQNNWLPLIHNLMTDKGVLMRLPEDDPFRDKFIKHQKELVAYYNGGKENGMPMPEMKDISKDDVKDFLSRKLGWLDDPESRDELQSWSAKMLSQMKNSQDDKEKLKDNFSYKLFEAINDLSKVKTL